jgi:OPA family glycerol-3-phosphate transporter-like MFS transporter
MSFFLSTNPIIVAVCAITISFLVISVHSLMSGTAAADFGGKKMTATASGITDGFVYLGSALQSFAIAGLVDGKGFWGTISKSFNIGAWTEFTSTVNGQSVTTLQNWTWWPVFLVIFPLLGLALAWRIWHEVPEATRKYLASVENIHLGEKKTKGKAKKSHKAHAH